MKEVLIVKDLIKLLLDYNPYAENMDEETINEFADDVQELYDMCFCKECYSWLKLRGKEISCDKKCNGKVYHIK